MDVSMTAKFPLNVVPTNVNHPATPLINHRPARSRLCSLRPALAVHTPLPARRPPLFPKPTPPLSPLASRVAPQFLHAHPRVESPFKAVTMPVPRPATPAPVRHVVFPSSARAAAGVQHLALPALSSESPGTRRSYVTSRAWLCARVAATSAAAHVAPSRRLQQRRERRERSVRKDPWRSASARSRVAFTSAIWFVERGWDVDYTTVKSATIGVRAHLVCGARSKRWFAIADELFWSHLSPVGHSVQCGRSTNTPGGRAQAVPKCNNECAIAKRNARLADALGITADSRQKVEAPTYHDELVAFARSNPKFLGVVEKTFDDMVTTITPTPSNLGKLTDLRTAAAPSWRASSPQIAAPKPSTASWAARAPLRPTSVPATTTGLQPHRTAVGSRAQSPNLAMPPQSNVSPPTPGAVPDNWEDDL
ncbi:hypothetical protein H0H81_006145 [Sphagnurus paluster]|uniref:Uncharacterized protein n=1 Tax=Sphagnurus paluster TaxID=117069 RepID=A0A9P7K3Q2_9AGAR|nr:hypothetical protein H0H81_006145 [Sphagnurus paluster]